MSDVDTTVIDMKLDVRTQDILEWGTAYTDLQEKDYWVRLKEICWNYDDICDRMKMDHNFTLRELYNFTVFSVYIITQIDDNILLEDVSTIRTTLSSITFNKDSVDITRWKAWWRNVLINTYDMRDLVELFEIITHELMHILDLWVIDDPFSEKNKQYKERWDLSFWMNDRSLKFYSLSWQSENQKRNSFRNDNMISIYAQTNTFEEIAEFWNAWINHQVPLLAIAREDPVLLQKYLLFKQLFWERYINKDIETYRTKDLGMRPRDTTRRHDTVDSLDEIK